MKKQLLKPFRNITVIRKKKQHSNIFISVYNSDQHINSINSVVRVQLAQRRIRSNDGGGFGNRGGLLSRIVMENSKSFFFLNL
jgi:hypothetical protein